MENLLKNLKPGDKITLEAEIVESDGDLAFIRKEQNHVINALIDEFWIVDLKAKINKDSFKLI